MKTPIFSLSFFGLEIALSYTPKPNRKANVFDPVAEPCQHNLLERKPPVHFHSVPTVHTETPPPDDLFGG